MLILFVDMNFFLQCRVPEELAWSDISADDITILIPQAVFTEIDRLKNDGNSRRAKRARSANSILDVLLSSGEKVISCSSQDVRIKLHDRLNIASKREETLDLSVLDDRIVNEVLVWRDLYPERKVALLTYDRGLMRTARHCGVTFYPVPESWLLDPEPDERDKKIRLLEKHIDALESSFPQITISNSLNATEILYEIVDFSPLNQNDIDTLYEDILISSPRKINFTSEEQNTASGRLLKESFSGLRAVGYRYIPPSDKDIRKYNDEYSEWEFNIRSFLEELHVTVAELANAHRLSVRIDNHGGVPAQGVIAEFSLSGDAEFEYEDPEIIESLIRRDLELPKPPTPPCGKVSSPMDSLYAHQDLFAGRNIVPMPQFTPRDPYGWYLQEGQPQYMTYSCQEFMHQMSAEEFCLVFKIPSENSKLNRFVLKCKVHARNIPVPLEKDFFINVSYARKNLDEHVTEIRRRIHTVGWRKHLFK